MGEQRKDGKKDILIFDRTNVGALRNERIVLIALCVESLLKLYQTFPPEVLRRFSTWSCSKTFLLKQ